MNLKVKNMIYCSMFACIIVILAQVQITLPSLVPLTLQTLGIYLTAILLKPRLALITSLVYVLMGAIGLPVFTGFSGGIGILLGPTGGYIYSFPLMALIISMVINHHTTVLFKIIAMILGTLICYLIGTLWFMYVMQMSLVPSLIACVLPFLPGDAIKIIIAAFLSNKLKVIKD